MVKKVYSLDFELETHTHSSTSVASYGVCLVDIFEEIDCYFEISLK